MVAGRPNLVQRLWAFLQLRQEQLQQKRGGFLGGGSNMALIPFSSSFSFSSSSSVVLSSELEEEEGDRCAAALLCALLSQLLVVLDDSEMYDDGKPLPPHQLRRLVKWLRELLFQAFWNAPPAPGTADGRSDGSGGVIRSGRPWATLAVSYGRSEYLRSCGARLLRDLYDRSSRRPFVAAAVWHEGSTSTESGRVLAEVQGATPRGKRLLTSMPYALPFVERLRLFKQYVDTEKAMVTQQSHGQSNGVRVRIRRGRVLEDGLRELNGLGPALKRRLQVEFINEFGAAETGVDVGGLFKVWCPE